MKKIYAVAPANAMKDLTQPLRAIGEQTLRNMGFEIQYGKNTHQLLLYLAGECHHRVNDIHEAFCDNETECIMSVYGGYNSNQLLPYLDYSLIDKNPKYFIGYSDITALLMGLFKFTNVPCIHGPGFSNFCDPNLLTYTRENFCRVLNEEKIEYRAPLEYASDLWYLKSAYGPREIYPSKGWQVYKKGTSEAPIMGGNLQTICALAGTPYFPDLNKKILFIEECDGNNLGTFLRSLTQLNQMQIFDQISGLIIGAFPQHSKLNNFKLMQQLLDMALPAVCNYPILYNVNCSHIDPIMSIRLGAKTKIETDPPTITIGI